MGGAPPLPPRRDPNPSPSPSPSPNPNPNPNPTPNQVRRKYPHDENLIELFQRFFMLLPIASVVGSWAFVIHGGLFRDTNVTLDDLRKVNTTSTS